MDDCQTGVHSLTYNYLNLFVLSVCTNGAWDCGDVDCTMTVSCPKNQEYITNMRVCGRTCASYDDRDMCPPDEPTRDGCGCPQGKVLNHEGYCVEPDECPCYLSGEYYQPEEEVPVGCKDL
jgi:hypothetical protein